METALPSAPALRRPSVRALRTRGWQRREVLVPPFLFLVATAFTWKLVYLGLVVIGYDTMTYFFPYRAYAAQAIRQGSVPLWNPYLYLGVPLLANIQAAVFYPLNVLFYVLPTPEAMNWSVVLHLFLAAYFTYLLARVALQLDRVSSLVAGLAYGFGGFVGAQVGHINQLNAAVWLPLLLVTVHLAWHRRSVAWTIATGLLVATQLLAGHAQESYMSLVAIGLYLAFLVGVGRWALGVGAAACAPASAERPAPNAQRLRGWLRRLPRDVTRAALIFGTAAALGGGLAAVQLLPTQELTAHSIRAGGLHYGDAVSFSLPPRELFIGLLPHFSIATPTSNEYVGYVGVVGLILALLAVLFRPLRPETVFFAGLAALAFLLALGAHGPLYPRLYHAVPGLNLFRVPARWLMLNSLALAMLAGIGMNFLRHLGRQGWPDLTAGPWGRLIVASRLLLALVVLALAAVWLAPLQRVAAGANTGPLPASLLQLWAAMAGGGVILAFVALAWAPSRWPSTLFAALALVELFAASRSLEYNNPNPREVYTAPRPTLTYLRSDQEFYRILSIAQTGYQPSDAARLLEPYYGVLSMPGREATLINTKYKEILSPNLPMAYGIATVDGYDGGVLPLRRYVEIKGLFVPRERNVPDALLRDQLGSIPQPRILNLLGVKYVLRDRMRDLTRDGVTYDLSNTVRLARPVDGGRRTEDGAAVASSSVLRPPSSVLSLHRFDPFVATHMGVVSALEGGGAVPQGAPVARITVESRGQRVWSADLRAGIDTSEARYAGGTTAHLIAGTPHPRLDEPGAQDYLSVLALGAPVEVTAVRVDRLPGAGDLALRGISLIDLTRGAPRAQPVPLSADDSLRLVHQSDVKIYRNETSLPRAHLVYEATLAADDAAILRAVGAASFDPRAEAVLQAAPEGGAAVGPAGGWRARARRLRRALAQHLRAALGLAVPPDLGLTSAAALEQWGARPDASARGGGETTPGTARLTFGESAGGGAMNRARTDERVEVLRAEPETMALLVHPPAAGLLVIHDAFYPGWEARVDGQAAPLLRANYVMRAVPVPAGTHTVELRYRSIAFERGLLLSATAGVLAFAALALAIPRSGAGSRGRELGAGS